MAVEFGCKWGGVAPVGEVTKVEIVVAYFDVVASRRLAAQAVTQTPVRIIATLRTPRLADCEYQSDVARWSPTSMNSA